MVNKKEIVGITFMSDPNERNPVDSFGEDELEYSETSLLFALFGIHLRP